MTDLSKPKDLAKKHAGKLGCDEAKLVHLIEQIQNEAKAHYAEKLHDARLPVAS